MINDPEDSKNVYARDLLEKYSKLMNEITSEDIMKQHEESYQKK